MKKSSKVWVRVFHHACMDMSEKYTRIFYYFQGNKKINGDGKLCLSCLPNCMENLVLYFLGDDDDDNGHDHNDKSYHNTKTLKLNELSGNLKGK